MLKLYVSETCPFCKKVENFFDENNIPYEKEDINDSDNLEYLIKIGGKKQVPFLIDMDNRNFMYESDDIINYAKELEASK